MIDPRVEDLLDEVGLAVSPTQQATLDGQDPILANRFPVSEAAAAALAAGGVAASDLWALKTGRTQDVRVDVRKAGLSLRATLVMRLNGGPTPPSWADGNPLVDFYQCRDGRWIHLHGNFPHLAAGTMAVLGCSRDRDEIAAAVGRRDAQELEDALAANRQCGAMARTATEWAAHPQGQTLANAPRVEITRIGDSDPEPLPAGNRPLSGIRVLDLTRILAGPTHARTLAQYGADVLHITAPTLPTSQVWIMDTNQGKLSAYLDLDVDDQRDRLRSLVSEADVFAQGFRAGALERRGFGPKQLAAARPGIIYVSINCYGHTGPWAGRPGSGATGTDRHRTGRQPGHAGSTSTHASRGVRLYHRLSSGAGYAGGAWSTRARRWQLPCARLAVSDGHVVSAAGSDVRPRRGYRCGGGRRRDDRGGGHRVGQAAVPDAMRRIVRDSRILGAPAGAAWHARAGLAGARGITLNA